jgi:membrane peptidoglycan carboxypeptidase
MTPHWQRLGFPFELVPSLASSIGSSADRPAALAELVRILQADGLRTLPRRMTTLHLAEGTPYDTTLQASRAVGERVLSPAVAQAARAVMTGVVEKGTARRLAGAFVLPSGEIVPAGGKTGSGDNRSGGRVINRTATFTFFIGDRYHGAMTAYVAGSGAARHRFTSGLVVAILKLAAPAITERLAAGAPPLILPSDGATGRRSRSAERRSPGADP